MKKILVANRGEIALNAIRCIQEMGLKSVGVYSGADIHSLHIRYADEVLALPAGRATLNYASVDRIIEAAKLSGAMAVYPGYGFLSESPALARACQENNLIFIGPGPETLQRCDDKLATLDEARALGIPTPEHSPAITGETDLVDQAQHLGYPVLLKPIAGSGGRLIVKAYQKEELLDHYRLLTREQREKGYDTRFYLEKYIRKAVHIEYPILRDEYGNIANLGERECVIQRRYQKLLAETPSPFLNDDQRRELADAAHTLARHFEFNGCGAIEFMVNEKGKWYFMEINPRIQLEYTLTEIGYGVEIIKEQIRLAAGERVPPEFVKLRPRGHAFECHINAEDPEQDFRPSSGLVHEFYTPGGYGYSFHANIQKGQRVEIFYDPMIMKLNCFAATRPKALAKMHFALNATRIKGVKTNIPFIERIISSEAFQEASLKCDYKLKDFLAPHSTNRERQEVAAIVAALNHEVLHRFRTPAFKREIPADNVWGLAGRVDLLNRRTL